MICSPQAGHREKQDCLKGVSYGKEGQDFTCYKDPECRTIHSRSEAARACNASPRTFKVWGAKYKTDGNPEPEYKVYEKGISLVLKPSEKYMLLVGQLYGRHSNTSSQNADVVDSYKENHALNAHDRCKRVLELISTNASISIAELALIMEFTRHTVDRDISWLKEHGYISRVGNSKSGCWRVFKSIDD